MTADINLYEIIRSFGYTTSGQSIEIADAIERAVLAASDERKDARTDTFFFEVTVKFGGHRASYVATQEQVEMSIIDLPRKLTNQAIDAAIAAGKAGEVKS
jgi:hypothetical protein